MTGRLQRLADMAIGIASAEAVVEEAIGFTLNVFDTALNFFETHGDTGAFYCRAVIGRFGNDGCPCEFAEDALKGNFFWRGTEGATLFGNAGTGSWKSRMTSPRSAGRPLKTRSRIWRS